MATLRRITQEQFIHEVVLRIATKGDANIRLDDMEASARVALANPGVRLFRPLIKVEIYGGRAVWRTPNAEQGNSS